MPFKNCIRVAIIFRNLAIRVVVEDTRLEAKDSLSEDRPSRGQGPRTQRQVFSKKKGHQKSFSGNFQFKGVARIFDWGGLNHKSHAMMSSKICLFFT